MSNDQTTSEELAERPVYEIPNLVVIGAIAQLTEGPQVSDGGIIGG